jgi:hypothetical protein
MAFAGWFLSARVCILVSWEVLDARFFPDVFAAFKSGIRPAGIFLASSNDSSVDGLRFGTTRHVVGAGCVYPSERHIGASPRVNQVLRPIGAVDGPTCDSCPLRTYRLEPWRQVVMPARELALRGLSRDSCFGIAYEGQR